MNKTSEGREDLNAFQRMLKREREDKIINGKRDYFSQLLEAEKNFIDKIMTDYGYERELQYQKSVYSTSMDGSIRERAKLCIDYILTKLDNV